MDVPIMEKQPDYAKEVYPHLVELYYFVIDEATRKLLEKYGSGQIDANDISKILAIDGFLNDMSYMVYFLYFHPSVSEFVNVYQIATKYGQPEYVADFLINNALSLDEETLNLQRAAKIHIHAEDTHKVH